eukprot:TRINITY_DN49070_c0_g1_i1.p2 TRINITY_DN49070_c0_g1~~TRINITY_DN49070_c0_g1_i1.p2  ORF type:complete len:295 (-),score=69.08 TRINITY_DN49070_c0_g1_i1:136-1020(-)
MPELPPGLGGEAAYPSSLPASAVPGAASLPAHIRSMIEGAALSGLPSSAYAGLSQEEFLAAMAATAATGPAAGSLNVAQMYQLQWQQANAHHQQALLHQHMFLEQQLAQQAQKKAAAAAFLKAKQKAEATAAAQHTRRLLQQQHEAALERERQRQREQQLLKSPMRMSTNGAASSDPPTVGSLLLAAANNKSLDPPKQSGLGAGSGAGGTSTVAALFASVSANKAQSQVASPLTEFGTSGLEGTSDLSWLKAGEKISSTLPSTGSPSSKISPGPTQGLGKVGEDDEDEDNCNQQ